MMTSFRDYFADKFYLISLKTLSTLARRRSFRGKKIGGFLFRRLYQNNFVYRQLPSPVVSSFQFRNLEQGEFEATSIVK